MAGLGDVHANVGGGGGSVQCLNPMPVAFAICLLDGFPECSVMSLSRYGMRCSSLIGLTFRAGVGTHGVWPGSHMEAQPPSRQPLPTERADVELPVRCGRSVPALSLDECVVPQDGSTSEAVVGENAANSLNSEFIAMHVPCHRIPPVAIVHCMHLGDVMFAVGVSRCFMHPFSSSRNESLRVSSVDVAQLCASQRNQFPATSLLCESRAS